MNDAQKVDEYVRLYRASLLKMNALQTVLINDQRLISEVLKKLGLGSALDVVNACKDDWVTR